MTEQSFVVKSKYDIVYMSPCEDGKQHELYWVSGTLKFFLRGSFTPKQFHTACKLVNEKCVELGVPLHTVRRVKEERPKRPFETKTKGMF